MPYINSTKNRRKKEDSVVVGTDYKHQRAKDYLTQELKQLLNNNKNDCIQTFLQGLTPTESTDYSLWKVTKKIKQVKKPSPPLRTS
jgi:predicted deacetylase